MNLKTSPIGIELIQYFEGCKLTSFKCPGGVWTIGYGHTEGVKAGDKIWLTPEKGRVHRFDANGKVVLK